MGIVRFGVSLEKELLDSLDDYVNRNGFHNRSQAIRHLVSENSVQEKWDRNLIVAGTIMVVYDHHKRNLLKKLNDIQHDYHDIILSSLHFHIDHHNCMEIIAVKGKSFLIRDLADKIISTKGIQHGAVTMTK